MEEKHFICLGCPVGCSLTVFVEEKGVIKVEGNQCNIGVEFAKEEVKEPKRKVTTSVRIKNAEYPLLPVYTDKPFPKDKIFELIKLLRSVKVEAPIEVDDIIIENVLNTGVNIRASRTLRRKNG